MLAALLFTGSLALTYFLSLLVAPLFTKYGFQKENYAGRVVPCPIGILFVPVFTAGYLLSYDFIKAGLSTGEAVLPLAMMVLISGMSFVGFVDDIAGGSDEKGFKGHISALLRGTITTGLFKACAGLVVSLSAAYIMGGRSWEIILNALLIALCANLFNLFDLRPGRAIKLFLPVLGLLVIVNWGSNYVFASYLLSTGGIAVALLFGDLREKFMLGDAGSNVMGGLIGLGVVAWAPIWLNIIVLGLVLCLNLLSEVVSFSRVIDSVPVFKWIDGLGRKGLL